MRALALLSLVMLGCLGRSSDECSIDSECNAGAQCTRTSECLPPGEIRSVRVTWTIRGMPASDTTCAGSPELFLKFVGATVQDEHGYAPVPCRTGLFSVDKLPRRFVSVVIGADGRFEEGATIDANGNAAFDLIP